MEPEPIHAAPVVTITATPEGVRIEGNMAPDLLLAVLWQAIHAVSMQVVQRGLMRVILLKDLSWLCLLATARATDWRCSARISRLPITAGRR